MSNPLSVIRAAVQADLILGKVVDADAYCRMFGPKYPELSRREIQHAVLQVVSKYGGEPSP